MTQKILQLPEAAVAERNRPNVHNSKNVPGVNVSWCLINAFCVTQWGDKDPKILIAVNMPRKSLCASKHDSVGMFKGWAALSCCPTLYANKAPKALFCDNYITEKIYSWELSYQSGSLEIKMGITKNSLCEIRNMSILQSFVHLFSLVSLSTEK